jgi:3-isopropylmalate/(R)-2-methylmalate dehydratase large subunit
MSRMVADGPRTLFDKLWDLHLVARLSDDEDLIFIDRHLVHEVSSPVAFSMLEAAGRSVRTPQNALAVADHAVSTRLNREGMLALANRQLLRLEENARRHGIRYVATDSPDHGIVHMIGPELGFVLPGLSVVCGDSHTSTHGALGALALPVGTSEITTVLATDCLVRRRPRTMRVMLDAALPTGVGAKDMVLHLIARIGMAGASGHAVEFCGPGIAAMPMAERMTLCNMASEAGAATAVIAPDETTFAYLEGRPMAPEGSEWQRAVSTWAALRSDDDAQFDASITLHARDIAPMVSWGTNPSQALPVDALLPQIEDADPSAAAVHRAMDYMGLAPGTRLAGLPIDMVFIGSCTNGRIEDLREAAGQLAGRKIAPGVSAMVVPGSAKVRSQAEREGLDRIFIDAGFQWRLSGCSMCVGMNGDTAMAGKRVASTSNRNFEGRQGIGARTHLMSPAMAAAAAVAGAIVDIRSVQNTARIECAGH